MDMDNPASSTTSPTPPKKRWSFFPNSPPITTEEAPKSQAVEEELLPELHGSKSDLKNKTENLLAHHVKKGSVGNFFARLVGSKSQQSLLLSQADGNNKNMQEQEEKYAAAALPIPPPTTLENEKKSPRKAEEQTNVLGSASSKPSTLDRVLSSKTMPFLSWLKGSSQSEEVSVVVNPMLHFATFAMNQDSEMEGNNASISSIHHVLSGNSGNSRNLPSEFWGGADDDSSVESFDSNIEIVEKDLERVSVPVVEPPELETEFSIEKKLQLVFDLPEEESYRTEFPCWLVRSVLLKGYIYVTEHHVCFYSALPSVPVCLIFLNW
jgi:hypothetical protein